MKLSVFCGVSVDGFLARPNHALDFLRTGEQEPHGFEEFYDSVDVVVIGRKTFEVVLTFGKWFYGKKPVVVLSSRPLDFSSVKGGVIEQMSGEPAKIVMQLKARGFKHAYIDGGITIQRFLAAGLIDRLVITRVPVLIGAGIPLFGPVPRDICLRHVETRCYNGGLVQSEYEVDVALRTRAGRRNTQPVHGEFLNTTGIKHLRGPGTIAGNERLSCSCGPFHRHLLPACKARRTP